MKNRSLEKMKLLFLFGVTVFAMQCNGKANVNNGQLPVKNNTVTPQIQLTKEGGHEVIKENGEIQMMNPKDDSNPLHLKLEDFALKEVGGPGRIYYKQPIDEALAFLGKPEKITERRKEENKMRRDDTIIYEFTGIRIETGREGADINTIVYNDNKKYILMTPRGIKLGDQKEKIIELYGEGKEFPDEEHKDWSSSLVYWSSFHTGNTYYPLYIQFELNDAEEVKDISFYLSD